MGGLPIYFEASTLVASKMTGIARCIARLLGELSTLRPVHLFLGGQGRELPLPPSPIGDGEDLQRWRDRIFRHRWRPAERSLARECAGVYGFVCQPPRYFRREINIVYDLTPMLVPQTQQQFICDWFQEFVSRNAHGFHGLLAISQRTKQDFEWLAGVAASKVMAAYLGPSLCVNRHLSSDPIVRRGDRLLVVSTLEPRKNALGILEWFTQSRALPEKMELHWAGPRGWKLDPSLLKGKGDRVVRLLGHVPDKRLCELYRETTATVYASFYEGFGFPVLDSLRHGAPVLCSYNSSLTEFEGPGVHYVDPYDPQTFDRAWGELVASSAEIKRPDLEQTCTWRGFAEALLQLCDGP
jgi:hypothetical protein